MAVRLREADSMATMAELRQKVAELEIQVNVHARVMRSRFTCHTEDNADKKMSPPEGRGAGQRSAEPFGPEAVHQPDEEPDHGAQDRGWTSTRALS